MLVGSLHVIYAALQRFCKCSFSRNLCGPLNRKQKLKIPRHVCYKRNCTVKRLLTRQRYKRPPNRLSTLGPRELLVPGFLTQNAVVFTLNQFATVYIVTTFRPWASAKQSRNLQKPCAYRDPVPPTYEFEFRPRYLKKWCVHICAQRVPYSGTVPGNQVWMRSLIGLWSRAVKFYTKFELYMAFYDRRLYERTRDQPMLGPFLPARAFSKGKTQGKRG